MTVPTNYGWLSSTSYMEQYRAGCISRTLSANPYNLCRFTDPDLDERKLYGTLEDGSNICQAIALVLTSPSLNLQHIIKSSDTFEVFDFSAEAPASSALSSIISKRQPVYDGCCLDTGRHSLKGAGSTINQALSFPLYPVL